MLKTSSVVKNNTEKSLTAQNPTYYEVLKDADISMADFTLRNHKSTQDQSNDCWDGYHIKRYANGDIYTGQFINGERSG